MLDLSRGSRGFTVSVCIRRFLISLKRLPNNRYIRNVHTFSTICCERITRDHNPGILYRNFSTEVANPENPESTWRNVLLDASNANVEKRFRLYKRCEAKQEWMLDFIEAIPRKLRRYPDYSFFLDLLLELGNQKEASQLLIHLASYRSIWWETLYISTMSRMECRVALECFTASCIAMKCSLEALNPQHNSPLFLILRKIARIWSPDEIVSAVDALSNPVVSGPLASAIIDANCMADKSKRTDDLIEKIWRYKLRTKWAVPRNLHRVMLQQTFLGHPEKALSTYDAHPDLQDVSQSDAILLAAGKTRDWLRLQRTFEHLDDPRNISEMGPRHYALVLQVLGHLGGKKLLEDIFMGLSKQNPPLTPTRGVFHALIHSYCVLGYTDEAAKYFHIMTDEYHIEPVRATFILLLQAYRDALDLKNALKVVGELMIEKAGIPLTNKEFSVLLSLCARRHDEQSGWRIWDWGTKSLGLKPDLRSYNAMLSCLIESNNVDEAMLLAKDMPWRPKIDTLTILLSYPARFGGPDEIYQRIVKERRIRQLHPDSHYFLEVMRYWTSKAQPEQVRKAFKEMTSMGITPTGDHYRLIMETEGKDKNFKHGTEAYDDMISRKIPQTFGSIEERLRMLNRPSSTKSMRAAASKMAGRVVVDGVFDETAQSVPRTRLPSRILISTIRKMLKREDYALAERLLLAYQTRYGEDLHFWALQLEVQHAQRNFSLIDRVWLLFMKALRTKFVLSGEESTKKAKTPVYKLASRHQNSFWRQVNIKMSDLARNQQGKLLLKFPFYLQQRGIGFPRQCWNSWIQNLLEVGELKKAFELVHKAQPGMVSDKTYGSLYSHYEALLQQLDDGEQHKDLNSLETKAERLYGEIISWIRRRRLKNQTVNITSWADS